MKTMNLTKIQHVAVYVYLVIILLLLFPSVNLHFLYSHGVAKIGLFVLFISLPFLNMRKNNFFSLKNSLHFAPFLLFFLSQGLSVINVLHLPAFTDRFEDLAFSFLVLFIAVALIDTRSGKTIQLIMLVFLISFLCNFISTLILFFSPQFYFSIFSKVLHPSMLTFIQMNLDRDRIFFLMFDEVFIPFVFLSTLAILKLGKKSSVLLLTLATLSILSTSLLSNFRTKILMSFFAIAASLFVYRQYLGKSLLLFVGLVGIFIFSAHTYFTRSIGFSIIDRFLFASESRDARTVDSRIEMVKEAVDLGSLYPIFGIGMGQYNYYIHPAPSPLTYNVAFYRNRDIYRDARLPHTIFAMTLAETGLLGITALFVMLLYLGTHDVRTYFRTKDHIYSSFAIAFWTLFIYAVLNPVANFNFWVLFFLFRGVLLRRLFDFRDFKLLKNK